MNGFLHLFSWQERKRANQLQRAATGEGLHLGTLYQGRVPACRGLLAQDPP